MIIFLKVTVLLCAAVTLVLRMLTSRYILTWDAALIAELNTIAYISSGVLLVTGIAWAVLEKRKVKAAPKEDKNEKNRE